MKLLSQRLASKLNNKSFIEKAPSEIINQNISNKSKIENDMLSLNNLRKRLYLIKLYNLSSVSLKLVKSFVMLIFN